MHYLCDGVSLSAWTEIYFSSTLGTVIFPAMDPESGASLPVAAGTTSEREENVVQHVIHVLLEKLKTLFEAATL